MGVFNFMQLVIDVIVLYAAFCTVSVIINVSDVTAIAHLLMFYRGSSVPDCKFYFSRSLKVLIVW